MAAVVTAMKRSTKFFWLTLLLAVSFLAFAGYTAFAQNDVAPVASGAPAAEAGSTGRMPSPSPPALPAFDPWQAVARIDAKIANTLIFLTVVAALIPVLVAIFEYFKIKEIEDFRKEVPIRISEEVEKQIHASSLKFERQYSQMLSRRIDETASVALQLLQDDDIAAQQILLSFLNRSSSDEPVQMKHLSQLFELQKSFVGMRSEDDGAIQASLQHLEEFAKTAGFTASVHLLEYLKLLEHQRKIMSLPNRRLAGRICDDIRKRHGIRELAIRA